MRFSERIGKNTPKIDIQIDSMDKDLENSLWNVIVSNIITPLTRVHWTEESPMMPIVYSIWHSFYKDKLDEIHSTTRDLAKEIKKKFFDSDYLGKYDLIEFLAQDKSATIDTKLFINQCNTVLVREISGYNFIDNILSPIINDLEIKEIEDVLFNVDALGLTSVKIHLSEGLKKLSDKKNPDYRNSIKESISAVESICQKITGESKSELGKTLKTIDSKLKIHSALQQGFVKIYGYTSDGDGIRHAIMDEPTLDQEDAIYMLVSCSSFINYLLRKANKAGIQF